ncbi:hypothetical protein TanjilG_15998 [Lupinus angustifolius]|uniref:Uncharacterized protein n=1 Tax=Lupinus angustifolius TaxID=3871 RepID=A0A4P1RGU4_LUPAN|nr:hypothetical protein TanjilG_15998 [Lupinus angustifolius]
MPCPKMRDAYMVSDPVFLDKDAVLCTAMNVGYARYGLDGAALEVYGVMIYWRIQPNECTLDSILISCVNLRGFSYSVDS